MWRLIRILVGLAGIVGCMLPDWSPLIWCAAFASGVLVGQALAEE